MMGKFKYETHAHSSETSKCSLADGASLARYYKRLGYTGLFITDHFFNGNTSVPPELPWEERVELFCRGFENTKAEGDKIGLDVFFGWEYSYGWCHLLTYGLGKEWLLSHPEVLSWDVCEYLDRVRADGGFVVHAHPFRDKIEIVKLLPNKIDAVEVLNASNGPVCNGRGNAYAEMLGLPKTAGSDAHRVERDRLGGIYTERRIESSADYASIVREGKIEIFDEHYDE